MVYRVIPKKRKPPVKKKYSIHDIARELNVSATTISFVLNGREQKKISEPVRKKILDFVEKIGYKPNPVAQSLRTGKSKIIGMLVEDISDPFFSGIARIIEQKAAKLGYKMFFSSTENNTSHTRQLLKLMRERQVEGYIMAPPPGIEPEVRELVNDNIPVVLFDRYFPDIESHVIEVDNYGGAYKATQHLIGNAYTCIAFITLESEQTQMLARLNGYLDAVRDAGLPAFVVKMQYGTDEDAIAIRLIGFLGHNSQTDAIFFATNYLTKAGIHAIKNAGLIIPDDIAVISFDDNAHFPMYSPAVTAVAQPLKEISERSISKLMSLISGKELSKTSHTRLDIELLTRESSLPKQVRKIRKV